MGSTVSYSESDDLFSNEVADTPVSQNVQRDQIEFSSVNLKDDAAPIGTIKVNTILVGHESVGKTAFKIQLTSESFNSNIQPTIGFEMFSFTRVFHRTQFEYQVLVW
jgi:ATP-dependent Clp protease ATP-binding subunit ClpA